MVELEIQLSYDKLTGKNDFSWEEIIRMTNSDISVHHLKKLACGYKRLIESDYLKDQDNDKLIETRKELIKLSTMKSEIDRKIRELSRKELLYEQISNNISKIEVPRLQPIINHSNNKSYVLHISDIHYGSCFEVEGNKYNIDITHKRLNMLLGDIIKKIKKESITKLIVVNTGDSIQGMLRMGDIKKNEIPVVESIIGFSKTMANFLNELSIYTNVEYNHVSSANHSEPRFIGSSAGDMPEEDFEKIIINYISDLVKNNNRITVINEINKPFIELDLQGFNGIIMHGHTIKNLNTAIRDLSLTNKKFYNYLIMGHIHHTKIMETDSDSIVLVAPSFVGVCPYSKKLLKTSNPGANFYIFEEGKGLTDVSLINLK